MSEFSGEFGQELPSRAELEDLYRKTWIAAVSSGECRSGEEGQPYYHVTVSGDAVRAVVPESARVLRLGSQLDIDVHERHAQYNPANPDDPVAQNPFVTFYIEKDTEGSPTDGSDATEENILIDYYPDGHDEEQFDSEMTQDKYAALSNILEKLDELLTYDQNG